MRPASGRWLAAALVLALSGCGKGQLQKSSSASRALSAASLARLTVICSDAQHALLAIDHRRLHLELAVLGRLIEQAAAEAQAVDESAEAKVRRLPRSSYVEEVLAYLAHSRAELRTIAQAVKRHGIRFNTLPRRLIVAFVRANSGCGAARVSSPRPRRGGGVRPQGV